jgi:hypothetical protein
LTKANASLVEAYRSAQFKMERLFDPDQCRFGQSDVAFQIPVQPTRNNLRRYERSTPLRRKPMHAEPNYEAGQSGVGLGVLFGVGLIGLAMLVALFYAFW